MRMFTGAWCALIIPILGCGAGGSPPPDAAFVRAALDSGNARFGAGDHAAALAHYRAAAAADTIGAAWFGVYMASLALGDTTAAEEALQRVRQLAPDADWSVQPHGARAPPNPHPDSPERAAPATR